MVEELFGVEIPLSIKGDEDRSHRYSAGYRYFITGNKRYKVPRELHNYMPENLDLSRAELLCPEVTKEESDFWTGYLTANDSHRDKTRSGARELSEEEEVLEFGRHFPSDLRRMLNKSIEF